MLRDPETIRRFVRAIPAPVNIFARLGAPSLYELEQLGAKRVSFGSAILRATLRSLQPIMDDLREQRHYDRLFEGG